MSGDSTVVLNAGTGGDSIAVYSDSTGVDHQKFVLETQTSTSDPVKVSSANPLPVTVENQNLAVVGNAASGSADSGNGVKVSGIYDASPGSFTSGQRVDMQMDSNGNLLVNIAAGAAAGGTSSSVGSSVPATGTLALFSDGTNGQAAHVDGSGNLKVNIASGGVPAGQDNTAFTAGTTQGLPAMAVYNDGVSNATSTDMAVLRCTVDRKLYVAIGSAATGGWSPYTYIGAATPAAQNVKSSPGQIGNMHVTNKDTNWVWVKVFNKASPTLGTDTPLLSLGVPPGGGYVLPGPLAFSTAIAIAVTGGIALTDNTSITASTCSVNIGYA